MNSLDSQFVPDGCLFQIWLWPFGAFRMGVEGGNNFQFESDKI